MAEDTGSGYATVLLYIDGEVLEGENGVHYSTSPAKAIRVLKKSKFNQLHDKICQCLNINTNMFKIEVSCRYPVMTNNGRVSFVSLPVLDDGDVCIVLDPQTACQNIYAVEFYLTRKLVCDNENDACAETREPSTEDLNCYREQCGGYGGNLDVVPDSSIRSNQQYIYPMDPGPSDKSVLTSQERHRSQLVWDEQTADELHCRTRMAVLQRTLTIHPRIIPYLQRAGFYGVARIGFMRLDWHLITAFVERWRPETHTFHLSNGEATITLQDVSVQLGLPVDGKAITGPTTADWRGICEQLLGVSPPDDAFNGSRLQLSYLTNQFQHLVDDADEEVVKRHARAYILLLIGGCLFADKSQNNVHLMFLPLLSDLDDAGNYSWGSATLAWLYRELCRATVPSTREIAGPLILLQLWAWDRCPHIAPQRRGLRQPELGENGQPLPAGALGVRWKDDLRTTMIGQHVLTWYRYQLDRQRADQMIWEPYTNDMLQTLPPFCLAGREVWRAVVPLICFHIVEWHRPDRVMRQFGLHQPIPDPCDTRRDPRGVVSDLHDIDLRGRGDRNWQIEHSSFLQVWDSRREHIIIGEVGGGHMDYHDPYMVWYRSITRRFISKAGGFFESDALVHIHDLAAPYAEIGAVSDIQKRCVEALHLIKEQDRLVVANMGVPPEPTHHRSALDGRSPGARMERIQEQTPGRRRARGGTQGQHHTHAPLVDESNHQPIHDSTYNPTTAPSSTSFVVTTDPSPSCLPAIASPTLSQSVNTTTTAPSTLVSTSIAPSSFPIDTLIPTVTSTPTASIITPSVVVTSTLFATTTSSPSPLVLVPCVSDGTLSQSQQVELSAKAAVPGQRRGQGRGRGRGRIGRGRDMVRRKGLNRGHDVGASQVKQNDLFLQHAYDPRSTVGGTAAGMHLEQEASQFDEVNAIYPPDK
ncbi:uncharacterized protein LOC131160335 isoform X2 [Malania oleifera]|uniref:uncharacterized protein LOC131160335 isoform X2 n=1 Tax=Malania oleifera TaxID=397392 RepID=UPI0025ADBBD4|nr:uncharacterized protein LOC131160335 isoform X2 [Malania oleifera]